MSRVLRVVGRVRRRAERGERGAALVEAALILPLVLLIVFGAIEFGFAFKDASAVSGAARAGGRIASAEPKTADASGHTTMPSDAATAVATALRGFPTSPAPEVWVYLAGPNGYPMGASGFNTGGCATNCVQYQLQWNSSSGGFFQPVQIGGAPWAITQEHVCPGDADSVWSRVGVYVQAHHNALTNMLPVPSTVKDHAVFRLEPVSSTKCP
jgi:Flp pilus assembly protein TadG